jgi:hypothetical protein
MVFLNTMGQWVKSMGLKPTPSSRSCTYFTTLWSEVVINQQLIVTTYSCNSREKGKSGLKSITNSRRDSLIWPEKRSITTHKAAKDMKGHLQHGRGL